MVTPTFAPNRQVTETIADHMRFELMMLVMCECLNVLLIFHYPCLFIICVSLVFLAIAVRPKALVPGRMQMASEMLYEFIASMIRENVGPKGRKFFPLIFTLFVVVMLGNS